MSTDGHSQWNILASVLIDKYFDVKACKFTDELEVVKLCEQNPLLRDYTSKWLSKLNQKRVRTVELTNKYRFEGNEHFDEFMDENDFAADLYTKAIFSAPKDSVELGLAYGNRAACLMGNYRYYEQGYFDCKLALQCNLPKESIEKLFDRRLHLANLSDKREKLIAETKEDMIKKGMQLESESFSFVEESQSERRKNRRRRRADRRRVGSNASIKNKNLTEKSAPSVGRFLITEEPIKENEPIYCEKAFAFVPAYTHGQMDVIHYACQFCATINCLPFPCSICARASYCSPMCLAAHEPIHRYECTGHQKNLWPKLGIGYLAFRTAIVGFHELVAILKKSKASTLEEAWSHLLLDCHKDEFSYGDVLRLVTHIDRVSAKNVLRYALTALLATTYLSEYTDIFSNLPPICSEILANVEDWKTLMTALILKHMGQAYFNGQTPTQLQLLPPSLYRKSYGYGTYDINLDDLHLVLYNGTVFSAFYPKLSMVNHSCEPNVRFSVNGLNTYAYAIRNIDKGEEILVCYGPHYKFSSPAERRDQLETEFFFECKCNRCVTNDTEYLKYYEYYCPDKKCNAYVELDDVDMRWWYYLKGDYGNEISHKFNCDECGRKLTMDPAMIGKFELAAQGQIDVGYTFHSTDSFVITTNLMNLYFLASKCLGKYHEMRARLAHMVLGFCVLDADVKLFPNLAFITMENYVNRIERYGVYTLEFVLVAAYALSILKMANRIERTNTIPAMARDIAKIRSILNVKVIEKSLTILPDSMQLIFLNIIRDLDVFADSDNVLNFQGMSIADRSNGGSNVNGSNSEKSVD